MPNGCRGEARCPGACSCTPPGRPGGDRTAKEQELPPLDRHAQKTTHPLPSRRTHAGDQRQGGSCADQVTSRAVPDAMQVGRRYTAGIPSLK